MKLFFCWFLLCEKIEQKKQNKKEYNQNILKYLTKKFNELNKQLLDKYGNLLIVFNNDNLSDQTYDKTQTNCDIDDQGFSKADEISSINDQLINVMTTNISDINNENQLENNYNIKLYELGRLIKELIDNLDFIPINIYGKNLLIEFLAEKQEIIIKTTNESIIDNIDIIDNITDDINEYCKELSLKYYFDKTSINDIN